MTDDPNSLSQSLAAHDVSRARNTYNLEKLGNYKIIKKLGAGGMGAVYLAEDVIAQRQVALKVLPLDKVDHPNAVSRFRREAKAIGKLSHPNIIQAYALGEEHGFHFYAMERCEGRALDAILEEQERLPIAQSLDYIIQAARGLEHAHEHGIIHRDIKPGNLFITTDGLVKILDLGLSKNISSDLEQSFVTGTGTILGTPYYISPEQALGKTEIDGRTDIYSLGATLYHLVTGHTPFSGTTPAVIVSKHLIEKLRNPHDLNPEISESLVQVIERMMAKAPEDRYANCTELLEDLEAVANGEELNTGALASELTSILPRSAVLTAATDAAPVPAPAAAVQPATLAKKVQHLPFGAKVVGVCGVFAALLAVLLVARALVTKSAAPQAQTVAQSTNSKPTDATEPLWEKVDEPVPPPDLPPDPAVANDAAKKPAAPATATADTARKPAAHPAPPIAAKPLAELPQEKDGYRDLLTAVLLDRGVRNLWKLESGALHSDSLRDSLTSVPVELPKEYNLKFEFSATGRFGILLPCEGKSVVWMITNNPCASTLGSPAAPPPVWNSLRGFDPSRKHAAMLEVRPEHVRLFIDDLRTPLQEWKPKGGAAESGRIPWFDGDQTKIGLSSMHGSTTIYTLKLKDADKSK